MDHIRCRRFSPIGGHKACRKRVHDSTGRARRFDQHGFTGRAATSLRGGAFKRNIETDDCGSRSIQRRDHASQQRIVQRTVAEAQIRLGRSGNEDERSIDFNGGTNPQPGIV